MPPGLTGRGSSPVGRGRRWVDRRRVAVVSNSRLNRLPPSRGAGSSSCLLHHPFTPPTTTVLPPPPPHLPVNDADEGPPQYPAHEKGEEAHHGVDGVGGPLVLGDLVEEPAEVDEGGGHLPHEEAGPGGSRATGGWGRGKKRVREGRGKARRPPAVDPDASCRRSPNLASCPANAQPPTANRHSRRSQPGVNTGFSCPPYAACSWELGRLTHTSAGCGCASAT
jgi:hypothetical protein